MYLDGASNELCEGGEKLGVAVVGAEDDWPEDGGEVGAGHAVLLGVRVDLVQEPEEVLARGVRVGVRAVHLLEAVRELRDQVGQDRRVLARLVLLCDARRVRVGVRVGVGVRGDRLRVRRHIAGGDLHAEPRHLLPELAADQTGGQRAQVLFEQRGDRRRVGANLLVVQVHFHTGVEAFPQLAHQALPPCNSIRVLRKIYT